MPLATTWNDERIMAMLVELQQAGKSSGEIASTLAREFNLKFTRNMIISKLKRMNLPLLYTFPGRPPRPRKPTPTRERRRRITRVVRRAEAAFVYDGRDGTTTENDVASVSFSDLKKGLCHWPVGDPREASFGYCGKETSDGHEYCDKHRHIKRDARKDKAAPAPRRAGRFSCISGVST